MAKYGVKIKGLGWLRPLFKRAGDAALFWVVVVGSTATLFFAPCRTGNKPDGSVESSLAFKYDIHRRFSGGDESFRQRRDGHDDS